MAGLLEVVIGVVMIRHLDLTKAAIGLFIGIVWIVQGVVALMAGIMGGTKGQRGWVIGFGVISLVAGIVVVAVPAHSVNALATLLGIWFLIMGVLEIVARLRPPIGTQEGHGLRHPVRPPGSPWRRRARGRLRVAGSRLMVADLVSLADDGGDAVLEGLHDQQKPSMRPTRPSSSGMRCHDAYVDLIEAARTFHGVDAEGIALATGESVYLQVGDGELIEERRGAGTFVGRSHGVDPGGDHRMPPDPLPGGGLQGALHPGRSGADGHRHRDGDHHLDPGGLPGGAQTRECLFAKLIGVHHDAASGATTFSMSNRNTPVTVRYGPGVSETFEFRLDMALAHFRGTVDEPGGRPGRRPGGQSTLPGPDPVDTGRPEDGSDVAPPGVPPPGGPRGPGTGGHSGHPGRVLHPCSDPRPDATATTSAANGTPASTSGSAEHGSWFGIRTRGPWPRCGGGTGPHWSWQIRRPGGSTRRLTTVDDAIRGRPVPGPTGQWRRRYGSVLAATVDAPSREGAAPWATSRWRTSCSR